MDTPPTPENVLPEAPPTEVDEIVRKLNYPQSVVKVAATSCPKTRAELLYELREEVRRMKWNLGMKRKTYEDRKRGLVEHYGEDERKREMILADEIERRVLKKKYLESIKNGGGQSETHSRRPPRALEALQHEECRSQSPVSDNDVSPSTS